MVSQPRQRPARQCHPLAVGTDTGHRDRLTALLVGDPAGTPALILRVKRRHPALVEVVDDAPHVALVGHPHQRDLRHRVADIGRNKIAARSRVAKCLASLALRFRRRASSCASGLTNTSQGTHHHLQTRDTSPFAARREFPVKPYEKAH